MSALRGNSVPRWIRKPRALPPESEGWPRPWVFLRYHAGGRHIYPAMIGAASPDAAPGDLVHVFEKGGKLWGAGLYNPRAPVPVRLTGELGAEASEALLDELIERALSLRLDVWRLQEETEAFRAIHSDGDGLGGLAVDRLGSVLSVEVRSLGVWRRLERWLPRLRARLGTRRERIAVDPVAARLEGIAAPEPARIAPVKFREHGVRYEVDFRSGHKTGFFCDQRENRLRFARLAKGLRVLDLCCYTGGFALAAKVLGGAAEATGVDLDETALAQARRNAHLNQARVRWVHADAFAYARQMARNGTQWDAVVLDPPKFVESRGEAARGRRKYEDLNRLAVALVRKGGWLVSCSCSGLLPEAEFEQLVIRAAHRQGRRLQLVDRTGAGQDHPVFSDCLEGRYLKVLWARVW
ncbi:MAG: class I SAM-dependent rRNA methyltransferase [Verrucomicrobia bacterium]|nr:class I SAM-dependent rRNA methyltransferase [Verrucomicrobiota bacterium]